MSGGNHGPQQQFMPEPPRAKVGDFPPLIWRCALVFGKKISLTGQLLALVRLFFRSNLLRLIDAELAFRLRFTIGPGHRRHIVWIIRNERAVRLVRQRSGFLRRDAHDRLCIGQPHCGVSSDIDVRGCRLLHITEKAAPHNTLKRRAESDAALD
jgi:hypothetical protein